MELKEKENIGTDFSQYLDILNKNSGVSDEEKEPFMRDILLLKKLFDGEIKISLGRGFFGSDNLLKGFASEQLAKIKSTINKVVAFARDENPELYTEEEYRIEEGEKGTSVDTVDNSIKKRRADRAALKKPNANTLEEERAVAALKKRNANTLEEERAAAAALKKRNANTLDEERAAAAAVIGLFNGEYQNSPVFPPKKADEELIVEDLNVEELSSRPSTASSLASTSSSNSGGPIRLSRPSSTAPHLGISLPPLGNRSISQKNKKTVAKDLLANGLRNFQESEKIRKKLAKETLRNLLAKLTSINGAQARKRGTQAKKPTKTGGSRRTPR